MTLALDLVLVICFLLTMLAGLRNGFFRELFAVAGLVAGVLVALRFTPEVQARLPLWARHSHPVTVTVFVLVFLVSSLLLNLVGRACAVMWEGKEPNALSRIAGLALGAARGVLLLLVLAGALALLSPPGSAFLGRSRVLPYLSPGVVWGAQALPRDLEARVLQRWGQIPFGRTAPHAPARGGTTV